jgi:hypothetical protein
VPSGLLAHTPPTITMVPAISDAWMNEHSLQDSDDPQPDCFWVEFERGSGGAGDYLGTVEATVYDEQGAIDRVELITADSYARICYPEGSRPRNASITLMTEPALGFSDVTVTITPE